MKFFALLLLILAAKNAAHAQNSNIFKRNPMQEFKLKRLLQDTLQSIRPANPSADSRTALDPGIVRIPLKGRFLAENENGDKVYAMTPDNMPCFVPSKDVKLNMPIAGRAKTFKSENPFPDRIEQQGLHAPDSPNK